MSQDEDDVTNRLKVISPDVKNTSQNEDRG
jgi:hypothetical protein